MEDFAHFISKPQSQCLQNQPRLDPSYKAAVCGNGKVEQGEQCDCGTQEVGTHWEAYKLIKLLIFVVVHCNFPSFIKLTSLQ